MLGAAWAQGSLDEYRFTQAAVVADQVASFVTPASVPDTGITIVVGSMQGEQHTVRKAIIAGALSQAGYRIVDLGTDVLPSAFLDRVRESRARIVVVFAENVATASQVGRVREMLDSAGQGAVALLVSGGPFSAEEQRARAAGAQGVVRSAEGALKVVASLVRAAETAS
jgi:methanogenic corrinoid protein MtbC1